MLICGVVLAGLILLVIFMYWSHQEIPNEGGVVYQHYKGGKYHVFGTAQSPSNPDEKVVVYRPLDGKIIYFRKHEEFYGKVAGNPRFIRVDHD